MPKLRSLFNASFFPTGATKTGVQEIKTRLGLTKTEAWMGVLSCDWRTSSLRTAASGLASYYQNLVSKRSLQGFGTVRHKPLSIGGALLAVGIVNGGKNNDFKMCHIKTVRLCLVKGEFLAILKEPLNKPP